jgi:predicted transcriptional regulator
MSLARNARNEHSMAEEKESLILQKKIMRILSENNGIGRTALAQAANIQYSRLVSQLARLESRQFVKLEIRNGKVVVVSTEKGRDYTKKLSELDV